MYKPTRRTIEYLGDISRHDLMFRDGYRRAFYNIGKENTRYAKELILKPPKTGRLYYIPGRKKRHRASAPGEAPANLTGKLRKGVDFHVQGWDLMRFGDTVFYGKFLELGTRKMEPRPHLVKAVRHNEPFAERELGMRPIGALRK